jgi:hypothetical protein
MGTAVGDLVATLGMNTAPWASALANSSQMLNKFGERTGGVMSSVRNAMGSAMSGLGMGVGFGAVLAGGQGLKAFFMDSIGLAQESAREQKKLGIMLASTGASADLSAGQISRFAEATSKTTNFSKEATVAAASAMAVFKSRMSGDTFQGALKAAQDISSIMGGDLPSTARSIGMALADPVRGMRLLRREGILFTDEQKKQIKNAVSTNDLAAAQKVILSQVNNTFGGDAQKMVSPMTQLKNAFLDVGRTIGGFLLPYVRKFTEGVLWAVTTSIAWVSKFGQNFGDVIQTVSDFWNSTCDFIAGVWSGAMETIFGTGTTFQSLWQGVLETVGGWVHDVAFAFRNFGTTARLAFSEVILYVLNTYPSMEGPIKEVADFFVGTWSGIHAFFFNIINSMIGGLREFDQLGNALSSGLGVAIDRLDKGQFAGLGGAAADAFIDKFAHQTDVKAPNAFAQFGDEYRKATANFDASVRDEGGMGGYVSKWNRDLKQKLGDNEVAFQLRAAKERKDAAGDSGAHPASPQFNMPNIGGANKAAKSDKPSEGPKALEKGSDEAWRTVIAAMYNKESDADKAALATASNTATIAQGIENLTDVLAADDAYSIA